MKSGHSFWTKYREASEVIGLHGLFSDYWSSNNHEFTVLSRSIITQSVRTKLSDLDRGYCHRKV